MEYSDQIFISLLPVFGLSYLILITFNYFALTWPKRQKTAMAMSKLHSSFIGIFMLEYWYWFTNPLVTFCKKFRISPNSITIFSLFLAAVAGYFYYRGDFALAGWILIFAGTLDLVDGRVARETGQSSNGGAFLDSCSDRYADAFIYMGITLYFASRVYEPTLGGFIVTPLYFSMIAVTVFALMGTQIMSYVKARGEAVGTTTRSGLMQRGERIFMLAFFSLIDPFWRVIAGESGLHEDGMIMGVIIFMSVLINISTLVRFIVLFRSINRGETSTD